MDIFEYSSVEIEAYVITADRIQKQELTSPVFSADRFTSIQWKIARKMGVPNSQVYVQVASGDQTFRPYTYVIDSVYMSEQDQALLAQQSPSDFAKNDASKDYNTMHEGVIRQIRQPPAGKDRGLIQRDNNDKNKASSKYLQIGPIRIHRSFIDANQRRPYDDWRDITHHSMNYRIFGNMIPSKTDKLSVEVLVLS